MTWEFSRRPNALEMIAGLPLEGQFAMHDLIGKLETDPWAHVTPSGEPDGITYEAIFGPNAEGFAVMTINSHTGRIVPLQLTWLDHS